MKMTNVERFKAMIYQKEMLKSYTCTRVPYSRCRDEPSCTKCIHKWLNEPWTNKKGG